VADAPLAPSAPITTSHQRGIDPIGLTADIYNGLHLAPPLLVSQPWQEPLDFSHTCWEGAPLYNGCKLVPEIAYGNNYSAQWTGRLRVPATGDYTFWFDESDDGARLYIDDTLIMDPNWDYAGPPSPQTVNLAYGWHSLPDIF
jgi:hypothetical protein